MEIGFIQAEMPTLLTLAVTVCCAGLVFIFIRLVCGKTKQRHQDTITHTTTSESRPKKDPLADGILRHPSDSSEFPSAAQQIRRRSHVEDRTHTQSSDKGQVENCTGRNMGDNVSTPEPSEDEGSNVDVEQEAQTAPSDCSAADSQQMDTEKGDTNFEAGSVDETGDAKIGDSESGDTEQVVVSEEATVTSISQSQSEGMVDVPETLPGEESLELPSPKQPSPVGVLRRTNDSTRRTGPKDTSSEEQDRDSDAPKRHAGIFDLEEAAGTDESSAESSEGEDHVNDSKIYEDLSETTGNEGTVANTEKNTGQCAVCDEQDKIHKIPDVETRQDGGELKSPHKMTELTASKALLLQSDSGPLTSTPLKHDSAIKSSVVERAQILATDLQTQSCDSDNDSEMIHPEQPLLIDKKTVSTLNAQQTDCSERMGEPHTDHLQTGTSGKVEESLTSVDTFIVHSNVGSMVESKETDLLVKDKTKASGHAEQTKPDLNMNTITADLKIQTENNKTAASASLKSDPDAKLTDRYKEYAEYLLQRYESEVKQRERSEDWCEFLTSELDAHINARILAEARYSALLQRTKTISDQYKQLKQQYTDLENQLVILSGESVIPEDQAMKDQSPNTSGLLADVSEISVDAGNTLFGGVEEARAAWQEQFCSSSSMKSTSQEVLSFYDFPALSSSYDAEGNLLAEYDKCVAAGSETGPKTEAAKIDFKKQEDRPTEVIAKTEAKTVESSREDKTSQLEDEVPSTTGGKDHDRDQDLDEGSSSKEEPNVVDNPIVITTAEDDSSQHEDEEKPSTLPVHQVAKSIRDKTAMWEEKLSGRAHLRDDSDSDHDVLSVSGGSTSIRDAKEKLEERLVGKTSDDSATSSRCEFSDEMLDSVQKAKMAWEDRLPNSVSPGSANGSRGHSSGGDDNNNSKSSRVGLPTEVLGNVQQAKQLWQDLAAQTGSSHSSRRMSMEGEDDQQASTGISHIPEVLTQASEVSVQQTRQKWEQKMKEANAKPTKDDDDDDDKGLNLYVEDELENDASNEHLSEAVVADSIGNVSHTKMMWEQALREKNQDDSDDGDSDQDDDDNDADDERPPGKHSPEIPRSNRFSLLKKQWEPDQN